MKFIHSQELLDIPEGGKFFPRIPVGLLVGWVLENGRNIVDLASFKENGARSRAPRTLY